MATNIFFAYYVLTKIWPLLSCHAMEVALNLFSYL